MTQRAAAEVINSYTRRKLQADASCASVGTVEHLANQRPVAPGRLPVDIDRTAHHTTANGVAAGCVNVKTVYYGTDSGVVSADGNCA